MSRRKVGKGHVNHERWLVSYADFITLMFAFFVVLFSSAQMDRKKVQSLSAAIEAAFQQMGVFPVGSSRLPVGALDSPSKKDPIGKLPGMNELVVLQKELERALGAQILRREVALKATREGLVISLREIGFFDSGSAELRPNSIAAVQRIAEVLQTQSNNIRIEGHTDNVPIHNSRFASNWELSTARATEIIMLFITRFDFPATRLSAAGYAEYHPVASNQTAEGRAQNRRVDIVVLPSAPEKLEGSRR